MESLPTLLLLAVAVAFGAFVRAAIGFGLNLIIIPILALIMSPRDAVVLTVLPGLLTNPAIIHHLGGARPVLRRIAPLMVAMVVGAWLGAQLLANLDARTLSILVGVCSILFAAASALKLNPPVRPEQEGRVGPLVGLGVGVIAGSTNIYGPPLAAYFHSLGMDKRDFLVAFSLVFMVTGVAQVFSYASLGLFTPPILLGSLAFCVPMFLGLRLGILAHARIPTLWFNRLVLVVIFVSGINLILR